MSVKKITPSNCEFINQREYENVLRGQLKIGQTDLFNITSPKRKIKLQKYEVIQQNTVESQAF